MNISKLNVHFSRCFWRSYFTVDKMFQKSKRLWFFWSVWKHAKNNNSSIFTKSQIYIYIYIYIWRIFDLVGFLHVVMVSGFQRFIKIPPSYFPVLLNKIVNTNRFGPTKNHFQFWCPGASKTFKMLDFQNVEICKNNFVSNELGFSCILKYSNK